MFHFLVNRVSKLLQSPRGKGLTFGVISGVFIKVMALVFTLITVPMTIHYLGAERYGIWVTMISILAWVSVVDIGVANGLTPLLTGAFSNNQRDLAQGYVATAFWSLILSSFLAGVLIYFFWDAINWSRLFNVKSQDIVLEISAAMALALFIFLINIPISITQRIYLADQKGVIANGWQFLSSLAGVIGIYLATKTQGGLVYLVLGYSGSQLIVSFLNSAWLFGFYRPQLRPFRKPKLKDAQAVMGMGGMFFLNQLATLVVFQKDNILITHYLGPVQAANYSVMWQLFFYFNTLNLLIAPYLGPAFADAYVRNDLHWMRLAVKRYLLITSSITFIGVVFLTLFYEQILGVWIGQEIRPEKSTVLWMAIWTMVLGVQWPIMSFLNSIGRIKVFTSFYILAAILNIFISIALIKTVGVIGGLIASIVTMVIVVLTPSVRELLAINKGHST